jgi:hypothetical protein
MQIKKRKEAKGVLTQGDVDRISADKVLGSKVPSANSAHKGADLAVKANLVALKKQPNISANKVPASPFKGSDSVPREDEPSKADLPSDAYKARIKNRMK